MYTFMQFSQINLLKRPGNVCMYECVCVYVYVLCIYMSVVSRMSDTCIYCKCVDAAAVRHTDFTGNIFHLYRECRTNFVRGVYANSNIKYANAHKVFCACLCGRMYVCGVG